MKKRIETFYDVAFQWLINYGPKILLAIIILVVGQWVIRLLRKWINKFFQAPRLKTVRPFLEGLIGIALQVLLVLLIMQVLGIQMTIFAAVITALGVAAGFALSGTLQNFASGVIILVLRPYRIGDNIITQGQEGTVSSIQLFYTVVTSFDNKTIIVPNSKLSNEIIINLSRKGNRRIDIELKLSYNIDTEEVRKVINRAIQSSQNLLTEPSSRVSISTLEPDGYRLLINVWTSAHGFNDAKFELQEKILNDIKRSGIKLPGM
ncbi:MAG: mechanosensitive ion channel family protein [Ginsengibacter sp.]